MHALPITRSIWSTDANARTLRNSHQTQNAAAWASIALYALIPNSQSGEGNKRVPVQRAEDAIFHRLCLHSHLYHAGPHGRRFEDDKREFTAWNSLRGIGCSVRPPQRMGGRRITNRNTLYYSIASSWSQNVRTVKHPPRERLTQLQYPTHPIQS